MVNTTSNNRTTVTTVTFRAKLRVRPAMLWSSVLRRSLSWEITPSKLMGKPNKSARSFSIMSWRWPESIHSGSRATNCCAWATTSGTRVTPTPMTIDRATKNTTTAASPRFTPLAASQFTG